MSIKIIENRAADLAFLYDNTTEFAFGPAFADAIEAQVFLEWLHKHRAMQPNASHYTNHALEDLLITFRTRSVAEIKS